MKINDDLLSAFLDHELDDSLQAKVQREIDQSPTLQSRIGQLQRASVEANQFFKQLDSIPLSTTTQQFLDNIDQPSTVTFANQRTQVKSNQGGKLTYLTPKRVKYSTFKMAYSIAASVLIAVGGILWWNTYYSTTDNQLNPVQIAGYIPSNSPIYALLESSPSGETITIDPASNLLGSVTLTFASNDNNPCREFILQNALAATRNLACRDNQSNWQVHISIATPLTNSDLYVPASNESLKALDDIIDTLSDGELLTHTEEREWLNNGWQR